MGTLSGKKKAKIRYAVHCNTHGVENTAWTGRQVVVSKPLTKRQRFTNGCPFCSKQQE